MKSEIIEFSMQTGWEWFVQIFAVLMLVGILIGVVAIGFLMFKAIQAFSIYIKKNKER